MVGAVFLLGVFAGVFLQFPPNRTISVKLAYDIIKNGADFSRQHQRCEMCIENGGKHSLNSRGVTGLVGWVERNRKITLSEKVYFSTLNTHLFKQSQRNPTNQNIPAQETLRFRTHFGVFTVFKRKYPRIKYPRFSMPRSTQPTN